MSLNMPPWRPTALRTGSQMTVSRMRLVLSHLSGVIYHGQKISQCRIHFHFCQRCHTSGAILIDTTPKCQISPHSELTFVVLSQEQSVPEFMGKGADFDV